MAMSSYTGFDLISGKKSFDEVEDLYLYVYDGRFFHVVLAEKQNLRRDREQKIQIGQRFEVDSWWGFQSQTGKEGKSKESNRQNRT